MDFYRSLFFQSINHKKKYRLTKWNILCRPKDQGGLGIEVLEIKNRNLLIKWLFKLLNEEGMWQELLQNKYLKNKNLAQVEAKPTGSPFWKEISRWKDEFFKRGSFVICDGHTTRFWEDAWLGITSLANQYPSLYAIVRHKNIRVADVLNQTPSNIAFTSVL
jgi:hypothetical protein